MNARVHLTETGLPCVGSAIPSENKNRRLDVVQSPAILNRSLFSPEHEGEYLEAIPEIAHVQCSTTIC